MNRAGGMRSDVLILGAGAAGLMAAITAAQRGCSVVLLDHADRIGRKILISGGGRCNFTNIHCRAEHFLSANPHFARSALAQFTPQDFLAMVERHRIPYHEKTLGQLFCDRSARDIVRMLEDECRSAGVRVELAQHIVEVRRTEDWLIHTTAANYQARAVIVATGGLSIPKIGATDLAYRIAAQFGHSIEPCRPALVPLTWRQQDLARYAELSGISTEVETAKSKARFREKLLFTHRGLSGPAVLQISSYWKAGETIRIDLAPGRDITHPLRAQPGGRDTTAFRAALRAVLPQRLADRWSEAKPPAGWSNAALLAAEAEIHQWEIIPEDTEGYAKAEVTAGGVSTTDLSAQTMESRRAPGLYFAGESVDVTGHLGGYNFQWAWASGAAAGRAVSR